MGFSDDFNDNLLDPKWEVYIEDRGIVKEQNQRLEFLMPKYPEETGSYRNLVVSKEPSGVEGSDLSLAVCLNGCWEADVLVANQKVFRRYPENCYRVGVYNHYDPDTPDVGRIWLTVRRYEGGRYHRLYNEIIGDYPFDRDMVVKISMLFRRNATFYADWGLGEQFLVKEPYALPSYLNYLYMRARSDYMRYGTAWFDDVVPTVSPPTPPPAAAPLIILGEVSMGALLTYIGLFLR